MTSRELNQLLLAAFPELNTAFEEETSWQEGVDTGHYVTYEDVFVPFLKNAIEESNEELIERIMTFLEGLAIKKDENIDNLLMVAVFENIDSFNDPKEYTSRFKKTTAALYDEYHSHNQNIFNAGV